jgi:hypothetical protein
MMEEVLKKSYDSPGMTYEDIQSLKRLGQGIALGRQMVQRHSYDVPIETGDTVTSLNITLIQGEDDSGRVQIFIPSFRDDSEDSAEGHGEVSVEFRVSGEEIKGLILCGDRATYDRLSEQRDALTDSMEENGFRIKALSYGLDQKSRMDIGEESPGRRVPTPRLYRLAKLTVNHMVTLFQNAADAEEIQK